MKIYGGTIQVTFSKQCKTEGSKVGAYYTYHNPLLIGTKHLTRIYMTSLGAKQLDEFDVFNGYEENLGSLIF